MLIVQAIIEGAYNRSSSNDPGKLAQDPELIVHLDRVYQRLWALFVRARPDEGGSTATFTLLGGTAAVTLPADMVDILGLWNVSGARVHMIPATERDRLWHVAPSVYRVGQVLRSRGLAGDPIPGDVLTALLLDAAATLTTLASTIDPRYPSRHYQLLIDALALYLSVKDSGRDEGDRSALLIDLKASVAIFAAEYSLPPAALEWVHSDMERQAMPA